MIGLYGPRAAPFTEKVARGLALKKLEFELVEPESPEDYRRWNPETAQLPVIDIDGEGFLLREVAPGVSVEEVREVTAAPLRVADDVREMTF